MRIEFWVILVSTVILVIVMGLMFFYLVDHFEQLETDGLIYVTQKLSESNNNAEFICYCNAQGFDTIRWTKHGYVNNTIN